MFEDGLLATSILLMNCTLDDTRHGREGSLTRIMERITEPDPLDSSSPEKEIKPARSMVDMTLRKGVNDMFGMPFELCPNNNISGKQLI